MLPARIADYGAPLLDQLCTAGEVVWWRPRPSGAQPGARATTVATSPIAIVPRATLPLWRSLGSFEPVQGMSGAAERVVQALRERGALFFVEIVQASGLLARAGRGSARRARRARRRDGRLVHGPARRADAAEPAARLPRPRPPARQQRLRRRGPLGAAAAAHGAARGRRTPRRSSTSAKTLLRRYGVMCRRLLAREPLAPSWRELLAVLPDGRGARRDSRRPLRRAVRRRAVRA